MRIESRLCHLSDNKAVVQVSGWINEKSLGSALAESYTVEDAEDKAINRLKSRLNLISNDQKIEQPIEKEKVKTSFNVELPKRENPNIKNEPLDWSDELTAIDSEIKRLNWSRDDEIRFLQQRLGFNNRNKITKYSDIIKYLNLLREIDKRIHSKIDNANTLITESDTLLEDLKWDHKQGRQFLQKEFNVLTRKELNMEQLISFVGKLRLIKNQKLIG